METIEIKIAMLRKGVTGGKIAKKLNVSRAAVNTTIRLEVKSQRIRQAIADALEMPYDAIWPDDALRRGRHKKAA